MAEPAARKPSWSTPLLLLSFALVFLVLFNPSLSAATGRWVGYALNPVIGFGGAYPVLTIFFASVLLVLGTTTIRHFLVDWTMMARTQEVMRKFQKEFSEARKSNNTYKMKRLTEAQPKVFELQAGLQKDQLKPMAFTMLLVIPLFAWLGTTLSHPVDFAVEEAPDAPVLLVLTQHGVPQHAGMVGPTSVGRSHATLANDVYGFTFLPPGGSAPNGDIILKEEETGRTFFVHASDAVAIPESAKVGDLAAGAYSFSLAPPGENRTLTLSGEHGHDVTRAVLVFVSGGSVVETRVVADDAATQVTLGGATALYALVPDLAFGGDITGQALLQVSGAENEELVIDRDNVVEPAHAQNGPPVYPFSAKLPWQDTWSLQAFWWFLPNWILLYSLFGIPFGQIAQRALKLWEYRHVDLDADGRQAGESM